MARKAMTIWKPFMTLPAHRSQRSFRRGTALRTFTTNAEIHWVTAPRTARTTRAGGWSARRLTSTACSYEIAIKRSPHVDFRYQRLFDRITGWVALPDTSSTLIFRAIDLSRSQDADRAIYKIRHNHAPQVDRRHFLQKAAPLLDCAAQRSVWTKRQRARRH
jgi:hypothetical protein